MANLCSLTQHTRWQRLVASCTCRRWVSRLVFRERFLAGHCSVVGTPFLCRVLIQCFLDLPSPAEESPLDAFADAGYDDGSRMASKATRRGPMDEMRQLVRILVKIIPHSITFLASAEEGGGGNRISEERIKYFLDCTLGEAPRPSWGVPQGWGEYLAGKHPAPLHTQACPSQYCFVLVQVGQA